MIASIAHIKHLYLYARSAKPCLETVSPHIFVFGWYLTKWTYPLSLQVYNFHVAQNLAGKLQLVSFDIANSFQL